MSKRKRDPTFTTSEKEALIELVTAHFSIVESKKTDAVTMRHKNEEWRKIATEFNAISSIHPRDWAVLKNCWENLKKRAKQELTLRKQHFLGTGGGPPKKENEDPVMNRVLELIQGRVSGFVNSFDSDATQILASGDNALDNPGLLNDGVDYISTTSTDTTAANTVQDWSQYTPNMVREKKHPALIKSPSPDVQQNMQQPQPPDIHECHALSTPPRAQTSALAATSRRRPIHKQKLQTQDLIKEKNKSFPKANAYADEAHEAEMKILKIQEEKEKEILKQELLKTKQEEIKLKIFELQLKKLTD